MYTTHRVFDWESHKHFAEISCDYNPIHVDAVAARRTHAGAPIVHGIHSLLWMLDQFARTELCASVIRSLRVQFLQPIYVGDEVTLDLSRTTPSSVRARLLMGSEELTVASIGFAETHRQTLTTSGTYSTCLMPPELPMNRSLREMEGLSGNLSFGPRIAELNAIFPSAVNRLGIERVAALVSSSCLVGMVVPGLHSMFLGLDIAFSESCGEQSIHFSVTSIVQRFRLVRIGISGPGVYGTLETMSRMPPVPQLSMEGVLPNVSRGEFNGSTALIVGGSRGLGELTSKLIAAGGGEVAITYASGKTDADSVAAELARAGYQCSIASYDVRQPPDEQLAVLNIIPTHVYYFATPPIFRRKAGLFDTRRFAEFNSYYVTAFFELVMACARLNPRGIRVFYPSSTAVDTRPPTMTDYAMSKMAGEVLCTDISKYIPGVRILVRRLPRLPTDQTSSVMQEHDADPLKVILPIVREMHSAE